MALAWTLTDSQAKNIYNRLCNYYDSPDNLPNTLKSTGVFFGYANFTRDKLYYCIQYLKENYGRGWFTSDGEERRNVLHSIANELYSIFGGSVENAGIFKFLNWVYSFAAHDATALNYFQKGYYSYVEALKDSVEKKIIEPVNDAAEAVAYGVKFPALTMENPLVKYGLWALGGFALYKLIIKR